ncbi:hypothetical protein Tco_1153176 [Tanacetum coccineum]
MSSGSTLHSRSILPGQFSQRFRYPSCEPPISLVTLSPAFTFSEVSSSNGSNKTSTDDPSSKIDRLRALSFDLYFYYQWFVRASSVIMTERDRSVHQDSLLRGLFRFFFFEEERDHCLGGVDAVAFRCSIYLGHFVKDYRVVPVQEIPRVRLPEIFSRVVPTVSVVSSGRGKRRMPLRPLRNSSNTFINFIDCLGHVLAKRLANSGIKQIHDDEIFTNFRNAHIWGEASPQPHIRLCYWEEALRHTPWLTHPAFAETFGTILAWAIPPSSLPPQNDSNVLPGQWTRSSLGSWSSVSKFSRIGLALFRLLCYLIIDFMADMCPSICSFVRGGVPSRSSRPSGPSPLVGLVIRGR